MDAAARVWNNNPDRIQNQKYCLGRDGKKGIKEIEEKDEGCA
jgi:hypothetical protein